jgi:hypothetical protein
MFCYVDVAVGRAADVADVVILLAKHLHAKVAFFDLVGACLWAGAAHFSSIY